MEIVRGLVVLAAVSVLCLMAASGAAAAFDPGFASLHPVGQFVALVIVGGLSAAGVLGAALAAGGMVVAAQQYLTEGRIH